MELLIGGGLGWLLTLLLLPFFLRFLQENGSACLNYRGHLIPVGTGLVFVFVYLLEAFLLFRWHATPKVAFFLLGMIFFAFLGFIDDLLGSRGSKGLRGHFGALFRGRLTTGTLKALGGGVAALLVAAGSLAGRPLWENITAAVLIALTANTINLLDLRPGRAVKVSLLWFLILLVGFRGDSDLLLLAPLAGGLCAYAPCDLRGKAMLGDTGSNLIGAGLGMVTAWVLPFSTQLLVVAILILLHLFTEKYSLTEIVERNRFLRFLDRLGRRGEEAKGGNDDV
ncbi:glycosyl transferase family 4 [Thermacetogenium phaeum DSM 12270]|uniref:Glycosyl transferase family 4 n=1 Tax=Thermacetogenium phaeum (strain ATCC BAA-254 / DSM 26808 / PB) TaxID=1089553 RepID=K4LFP7_THEPS|nr:glycosyl transferase family protein [Thermacetogenium phaeum]AFV11821.1 glycosyl transferase family 4 [Thermacetogenium phaeum DSM 12270]